jgi:predicted transcriptional regulator
MIMEEHEVSQNSLEKYKKKIINFGLTDEEATVYLSLLKREMRGEIVGRIKNELEIGRTTIYAIMERLTSKGWTISEKIADNPKRVKYIAKSPFKVLNSIIECKEKELTLLKEQCLHIGDKLEQTYQGAKKLTIENIHPGGYIYLRSLLDKGWKIKSEVVEHSESIGRMTLDYELKGNKGFPKDCGLIIFQFERNIEQESSVINDAVTMLKNKTDYEIRQDKVPGFEDVKLEDLMYQGYQSTDVFIKLKFKKNWWHVGREMVIPIKNKVFMIFGNKNNFKVLFNLIIKSERFHHLI